MSTATPPSPNEPRLPQQISELLEKTRSSIRRYICIEGSALAIACLIGLFWLGMAIDYLPVRLGSSEMPVGARAVLLCLVLGCLLFVVYRWILARCLVNLQDSSLAILIERRFPEFRDSLVTSVEAGHNSDVTADPTMLTRSCKEAVVLAEMINVKELFDFRALMRAVVVAALLVLSLLLFALYGGSIFRMGISRLFGLSDKPYPRTTQIELIGFNDRSQLILARGDDLKVRVRADANRAAPVPTVCTIYYETGDGERGRVNMSRLGEPRDGFQQYAFDGMPFTNILSDIQFDVVGNDHRLNGCTVHVVESPQIAGIELNYTLPAYTGLLSRTESYRPGIQLAQGSRITLRVLTNKTIRRAKITNTETGDVLVLAATESDQITPTAHTLPEGTDLFQQITPNLATQTAFSYDIDHLQENIAHEITLLDTDGTTSRRAYPVVITATPDMPPTVDARLRGIGSAITQDARLPFEGSIQDDFGVASSWIELEGSAKPLKFPIDLGASGEIDTALDLRKQRSDASNPSELSVDSKVTISVHSQDRFDLTKTPNIGDGDRYELDVVTPSRLLALLEARELGLRRRFEQVISDFRETRDSLSRVQFGVTPESVADESDSPEEIERLKGRAHALRLLRVQRGSQQGQRASQEVLGVALSFDDVREELVNNRVDSEDRQRRLEFDISEPLKSIGNELFPRFLQKLRSLEAMIDDEQSGPELVTGSVRQADELLLAMERVLQKMLDLESYNELVDLVRSMIREQDVLMEQTKKQQKKQALDLLK